LQISRRKHWKKHPPSFQYAKIQFGVNPKYNVWGFQDLKSSLSTGMRTGFDKLGVEIDKQGKNMMGNLEVRISF